MGVRPGYRGGHLGGFGSPTFTENPTFSGTPSFTGTPTFSNGLTATGGTVDLSAADVTNLSGDLRHSWQPDTSGPTGTSGRCYAVYLGRAPRKITTLDLSVVLGGTAAATITWAEMALATGAYEPSVGTTAGTPDLTLRAGTVADISAEVANTNFIITKTLTPTTPIPAGTEIWGLVSVSATTQPVWRGLTDLVGAYAIAAATRPSTMAAPTTFTGGTMAAPNIVPMISGHIAT